MQIDPLIRHFDQYLPLEEEEITELSNRVFERRIKRKQFILQQGDVCKHYTFIIKGCFKLYAVDCNGKEHNLHFSVENEWIYDITSFHTELPSLLYIEAIEPSVVLQIERNDLLFFYINYPKFDRNFRVIIEDEFMELQNRVLQNISSTAEEKYLNFTQHFPHLINRLPSTQIASYLGITPEFLSKIRKELLTKKSG